ncbi:cupin domain-containing protein [Brevibacillus humidisoli]|uniref:helix-turn-helix domain-containing protein n=1 Tax=Brevibacillus humidisoli TaxID=2895522 RepID=UPI001E3A1C6C|nr:cupin domain-containing protein [Brevibacillus humidisoli]UFJ41849.1 cupin domain-containing protein [Brevibacillus humidisoli]
MGSKDELAFPKELIGSKIRQYRRKMGLTVVELAARIGLSQSALSQIERGLVNPSLDTLWKLSYYLEIPVFSFFKDISPSKVHITRREEQKVMTMLHPNVLYRLISPALDGKCEMFELIVKPGEVKHLPQLAHQGEECGYLIEGRLEVLIEDKVYQLEKGDSIYFDSTLEHKFYNPEETDAVGIWVMFP